VKNHSSKPPAATTNSKPDAAQHDATLLHGAVTPPGGVAPPNVVTPRGVCAACDAPNEYSQRECVSCGARLPWAQALDAAQQTLDHLAAELRSQERNFEMLAEATAGLIYDADLRQGTVRRYGDMEALLGFRAEEIEPTLEWWKSRVHPDDLPQAQQIYQQALARNASYFETEYRVVRKDAQAVWLWDRTYLLRDEDGELVRAVGQSVDITAQKKAQHQLALSRERSQRLVDANIIGVLFCDVEGTIREANDAFLQIVGYSREELETGRISWQAITPPGHEEADRRSLEELAAKGVATPFEKEYLHRDGRRVPVLVGPALLQNADQAVAFVLDLTRQKAAEEAMRRSEERYRMVSEMTSDYTFFCTVRDDGNLFIEWITDSMTRLTGYTLDDIQNGDWIKTIFPDDAPLVSGFVQRLVAGHAETIEHRLHTKNGELRWLRVHGRPVFNENRVVQIIGAGQDITQQRKIAEQQKFLTQASDLLASSLDYQTVLGEVTRLALPFFADYCFVDLLIGSELRQIAVAHTEPHKEDLIRELRRLNPLELEAPRGTGAVLRSGEPEILSHFTTDLYRAYTQCEYSLELGRQLHPTSFIIYPLRARGGVIGTISFVSDREDRHYTESDLAFAGEIADRAARAIDNARLYREAQEARRIAEEARQQAENARAEAETANRAKDEFLATVSHELRTPLNAILGWASLLQAGDLDEASTQQALETIERNARTQTQIVSDLLDVSRIITGKLRLETQPLSLLPLVESAVDSMQSAAQAKGVTLEVHPLAQNVVIAGDATRLQQVLWNLLSNAVRFTPSGGRVTVELEQSHEMARLCVADTGQGIAPEFLPFVFDRFRQAESSYTRKYSGLGLGLAIVRHIAEMHGGTVEAWSDGLNRGARFIVNLPLFGPPAESDAPAVPTSAVRANETVSDAASPDDLRVLNNRRVLVVDDQEDTRVLLRNLLQNHKVHVETASSASEALQALQNTNFDALVSDIGMPGEDGYSLIQKLRAANGPNRNIPAVAFSAFAREEDRQRALHVGFTDYQSKPISPREFIHALARLFSRQ
jgi:PAS domain S-box-containing protein